MKLGINILFLEPGKVGGSETFSREILARIDSGLASRNIVILYCTKLFAESVNYKNIIVKPKLKSAHSKLSRLFCELFTLPLMLKKDKVDVLLSLGYTSPLITHCKKIVVIHDTQFKSIPNTVTLSTRLVYNLLMPLVVRFNQKIIVPSRFSKAEVVKNLKVSQTKVCVIYEGVERFVFDPIDFKKRGNYIMTAAATHPHKNVGVLIDTFKILIDKYGYKDLKLYITGFQSIEHNTILKKIDDYGLRKKVKLLGWLNRGKYIDFLRKAKVFVFLSSYEGFGLPPLEAMAVGTTVVSSRKGSLKEILDNAYLKINNEKDPLEVAYKLDLALRNINISTKLARKGIEHARLFSWDKSYQRIVKLLKKYA